MNRKQNDKWDSVEVSAEMKLSVKERSEPVVSNQEKD